jgi:hypothetical protein
MPITYHRNGKITSIKHVGCVIQQERKEFRAMSDVYTDADYALVWLPKEERQEWIRVNVLYMGCDSHGKIEVDIHDGEYAEDYEIFLFLAKERKKEEKRRRENRESKIALKRVQKGRICRAIKGRKVPKGTEGKIFYIRNGRVGFKGHDGVAHWINDDQIEVMYKSWDYEPADSWRKEYKRFIKQDGSQLAYANGETTQSLKNPYAAK